MLKMTSATSLPGAGRGHGKGYSRPEIISTTLKVWGAKLHVNNTYKRKAPESMQDDTGTERREFLLPESHAQPTHVFKMQTSARVSLISASGREAYTYDVAETRRVAPHRTAPSLWGTTALGCALVLQTTAVQHLGRAGPGGPGMDSDAPAVLSVIPLRPLLRRPELRVSTAKRPSPSSEAFTMTLADLPPPRLQPRRQQQAARE